MSSVRPMQPLPPSALTELIGWWKAELMLAFTRLLRRKEPGPLQVSPHITVTREGLLLGTNKIGPCGIAELDEKYKEVFGPRGLPRRIVIALDERRVLKRKLADHRIPLVRAQKMAELDVETQTPFKLDEVYIVFSEPDAPEQAFTYYLIRRDFIDPLLADLRARRCKPESLMFEEECGASRACDFAVAALRGEKGGLFQSVRRHAFALACVALVGYAGYNVSTALANGLSAVDEEIASIEPKAKAARVAFKKQSDYLERIRAAHADQNAYVPAVKILEEMSSILPDSTYLTSLSMRQGKVKITGFSADAAALISLVDASKLLTTPRFASAVVRAPDGKKEQFDLEVEVERAR